MESENDTQNETTYRDYDGTTLIAENWPEMQERIETLLIASEPPHWQIMVGVLLNIVHLIRSENSN